MADSAVPNTVSGNRSPSGFDLTPPSAEERKELEAGLTREEADVLLKHGTEAPFCGVLLGEKRAGAFDCRLCGLPLFRSAEKFESGTGWPSFTAPYDHQLGGAQLHAEGRAVPRPAEPRRGRHGGRLRGVS